MENIFKTLVDSKIDIFCSSFIEEPESIFYRDNKLIHPGEFGMYRERALKQLLSVFLRKIYAINDGFIFNKDNEVSTQCDIIVNDSAIDAITTDNVSNFFPIEYVYSIGEVKSNLTKSSLKEAAIKLAKNKMIARDRLRQSKDLTNKIIDHVLPISFIVCNKIEAINTISEDYWNEVYNDIAPMFRHNLILSIEDGIFAYEISTRSIDDRCDDTRAIWGHPVINGNVLNSKFVKADGLDKYSHIYRFLGVFRDSIEYIEKLEFPIVEYLGLKNDEFENAIGHRETNELAQ
ncbi:DUF6602 domain-containing protein [Butyrivibrio sp. NC2007]|uniref:DUF6602 domain-containing protein n=1 Tax=Butyrivibrio sp. NC2007 TaxID=1280683 RepID=UPI0003B691F1|nr:DUF6602 domain-containing protein [Butyrivibrio sp. NC2007]